MKEKIVVSILLLGAFFVLFGCTQSDNNGLQPPSQNPQTQTYTLAQVSEHYLPTDCWMTIDGNVYNMTAMVVNAPNGALAKACGTDATGAFRNFMPGGQDFNANRRDFNGPRPDLNFPRDFNGARPDFNGQRRDMNVSRGQKGFQQYYLGKLVQ